MSLKTWYFESYSIKIIVLLYQNYNQLICTIVYYAKSLNTYYHMCKTMSFDFCKICFRGGNKI